MVYGIRFSFRELVFGVGGLTPGCGVAFPRADMILAYS